jgi:uncharacterized NAD-dependent epimerase/dehydratase family protein
MQYNCITIFNLENVMNMSTHAAPLRKPYLLFLGDETQLPYAKTAWGVRDWVPEDCVGQWRLSAATLDLGLPDLRPADAVAHGARSLVIGVAPVGGSIPAHWMPHLLEAMSAGLDIVSGMHMRLTSFTSLTLAAATHNVSLHDIRHSRERFPIASGRRRAGMRLLTVGTDCASGKKYTALALAQELKARGRKATFRATGQTGILISGSGVAVDAIVSDFLTGAVEALSPDNETEHWDIIEGQGSLFHPAYAPVTLGLLHGSQPDAIVLCHDAARRTIYGWPDYPLPDLGEAISVYLDQGRLTNPAIRCMGISVNTSQMSEGERRDYQLALAQKLALPVCDPVRDGVAALVDRLSASSRLDRAAPHDPVLHGR